MLKKTLQSVALPVAVAATIVSMPSIATAQDALARILDEGVIRVGVFNEVPVGFVDESGRLTGESPEVLRMALGRMGDIEMEASVVTEFGALVPGLIAKRFDVIAAGLYIRPQRCEQISFTRPTARYGETLVVAVGNPLGLNSYEDVLSNDDARLAVLSGSVELEIAQEMGIPSSRIQQMPITTAVAALRQNRVDAIAVPTVTGQELVATDGGENLALPENFVDPMLDGRPAINFAGFGVHRDEQALLDALNNALDDILNTPEHLGVVEEFGFNEMQLPGAVSAQDVCEPAE